MHAINTHLGVLKCNFMVKSIFIISNLKHVIHLELRLGICDRHGRAGGDVHMGQDSIYQLNILS